MTAVGWGGEQGQVTGAEAKLRDLGLVLGALGSPGEVPWHVRVGSWEGSAVAVWSVCCVGVLRPVHGLLQ